MGDQEEVRVIGPLEKLKDSLLGMLLGIILLPAAFVVVGFDACGKKASKEFIGAVSASETAKKDAASYATGKIQTDPLGDPEFVKPGAYLSLRRSGEIYAWEYSKRKEKRDGKDVEVESCKLDWVKTPDLNVDSKPKCSGKYNRPRTIQDAEFTANIAVTSAGKVYTPSQTPNLATLPSAKVKVTDLITPMSGDDNVFYPDKPGCKGSPTPGCERIKFSGTAYTPQSDYTMLGKLEGNRFVPHSGFLYLAPGDYPSALKAIESDDKKWAIIWFVLSVALFWGGLVLLTGPILQLIEFIPVIGNFGSGVIKFFFGFVSLVVMGFTYLFLKYLLFIVIAVVLIVVALIVLKKMRSKPAGA
ncbi:MAG: hypothetical protein HY042_05805 [Spirochaetia bacterium]|nr:hypothetical protein [Spirochaetia bacterium]